MTKEKIQDAIYTRRYVYNFHYHLIWATKYRHQTFSTKELADEMKDILRMVAKDNRKDGSNARSCSCTDQFSTQQGANQRYQSTKGA